MPPVVGQKAQRSITLHARPGSVFLSQHWKLTAPVYIGDTITASAEVLSVHPTKPVTQLSMRVARQDGQVVLEGEAWCYTFRPQAEGAPA